MADAQERAAAAPPLALLHESPTPPDANVHKAQELLLSPKPPALFTEPPKEIVPRYMERIPRLSGKEAAKDLPSWARGARRYVGETPDAFARRVMDEQWGKGKWERNTRRQEEFRQIKKWGSRAFRNPRSSRRVNRRINWRPKQAPSSRLHEEDMPDDVRYVYPLYHYNVGKGVDTLDIESDDPSMETTIVGIYSSEAKAEAAIERVRDDPRFRDWPDGFRIYEDYLDIIASGEEGFISSDDA